jgi:hypothetical protein
MGIQACSNEGRQPSQRGDNTERVKIYKEIFKNLLQNQWNNFNQTWHKSSLGEGVQVYSNEEWRPSLRGDNSKKV